MYFQMIKISKACKIWFQRSDSSQIHSISNSNRIQISLFSKYIYIYPIHHGQKYTFDVNSANYRSKSEVMLTLCEKSLIHLRRISHSVIYTVHKCPFLQNLVQQNLNFFLVLNLNLLCKSRKYIKSKQNFKFKYLTFIKRFSSKHTFVQL